MATVRLDTVWINDAGDLSDRCALPQWVDIARSDTRAVTYQRGASGRVRQIVQPGAAATWDVSIDYCPADVLAWLETHQARLLCLRDPYGRKAYGSFAGRDDAPIKAPGEYSKVSFTLTEVTHSEVV